MSYGLPGDDPYYMTAEEELRVIEKNLLRDRDELQRRLSEILDMIDGREDVIDGEGGRQQPNIFMRIGMCARGEDKP